MSRRAVDLQWGALPWRKAKGAKTRGEIEILLVTTRNTRRWIVPKGWPAARLPASICAAEEAFEETGVTGEISDEAFGAFRHRKQLKSGAFVVCEVIVFPLKVTRRAAKWPEKRARESRWCTPAQAAKLIKEPGLRRLIAKFAAAKRT